MLQQKAANSTFAVAVFFSETSPEALSRSAGTWQLQALECQPQGFCISGWRSETSRLTFTSGQRYAKSTQHHVHRCSKGFMRSVETAFQRLLRKAVLPRKEATQGHLVVNFSMRLAPAISITWRSAPPCPANNAGFATPVGKAFALFQSSN